MTNDPLVKEIHEVRGRILTECGGDLDKLLDRFKSSENEDRDRLVSCEDVKRIQRSDRVRKLTGQ
jgi:hypothetical protein